jgi:pyridoxine 4-dehydrogenase
MNGKASDSDRPVPGGVLSLAGKPTARVGYGMGQVARSATDSPGRSNAVRVLRRALDLGVTHFDTAQFYGHGLANELLHESLGSHRDELTIATKAGARPVEGAPIPLTAAQRPGELRRAVEDNLRSLRTDRIDIVYLRRMDFTPGLLAAGEQIVPLEDQLAELAALRDEGALVAIGLSHVTAAQLAMALPVGVAAVQNIYNLVDRSDEPLLDLSVRNDIGWVPYFPLGGGFGALPKVVDESAVVEAAGRLGATPSQVGLAWQLHHSPTTMIISGTSSLAHLEENVAAGALRLDENTLAALDAIG